MVRKLISQFLAVVLVLTAWSSIAFAQTQSYFLWNDHGGTYHDAEKFPNTGPFANTDDDHPCWAGEHPTCSTGADGMRWAQAANN